MTNVIRYDSPHCYAVQSTRFDSIRYDAMQRNLIWWSLVAVLPPWVSMWLEEGLVFWNPTGAMTRATWTFFCHSEIPLVPWQENHMDFFFFNCEILLVSWRKNHRDVLFWNPIGAMASKPWGLLFWNPVGAIARETRTFYSEIPLMPWKESHKDVYSEITLMLWQESHGDVYFGIPLVLWQENHVEFFIFF